MSALPTVREERSTLGVGQQIYTALSSFQSPIPQHTISPRDGVRLYRDRHGQWEGPFVVRPESGKQSGLADGVGLVKQFHVAQILPEPSANDDRALRLDHAELRGPDHVIDSGEAASLWAESPWVQLTEK